MFQKKFLTNAVLFSQQCVRPSLTRAFASDSVGVCQPSNIFSLEKIGTDESFRVFFYPTLSNGENRRISPWHDIPYKVNGDRKTFSYINEIPKNSQKKYEIATKEEGNPIKQDTKNGKLREFTYGKLPFNYGCIPQTWEDPNEVDSALHLAGDNDPIDVVEVSPGALQVGGVYEVLPLGALALIDEGEVDWKIIAVNVHSPLARDLEQGIELEMLLPGIVHNIRNWFVNYKTTDGKPKNEIGFQGHLLDQTKAIEIIEHTHQAWRQLMDKQVESNELWVEKKL